MKTDDALMDKLNMLVRLQHGELMNDIAFCRDLYDRFDDHIVINENKINVYNSTLHKLHLLFIEYDVDCNLTSLLTKEIMSARSEQELILKLAKYSNARDALLAVVDQLKQEQHDILREKYLSLAKITKNKHPEWYDAIKLYYIAQGTDFKVKEETPTDILLRIFPEELANKIINNVENNVDLVWLDNIEDIAFVSMHEGIIKRLSDIFSTKQKIDELDWLTEENIK